MNARENKEWIADLKSTGDAKSDAITDLRTILLSGLRRGLVNHVNTASPEFDGLAEDFVQEALLKVLANIDSFQGNSKFTTWAHKIAVRVALTELRRKRWQDRSLDEMMAADNPFQAVSSDPSPDKRSLQTDMLAKVQRIIAEELTDKQRQAMMLGPMGGVPMQAAADQMNMTRNAFYKLLHDARLRLKSRMEQEGISSADVLSAFE